MSWMYYNKETEETCLHGYISELSCFHAVVMAEQTWKIISKTSTKSGSSKTSLRSSEKFLPERNFRDEENLKSS